MPKKSTSIEKIEAYLVRTETCWLSTRKPSSSGYPRIIHDGKEQPMSRVMWFFASGEWPPKNWVIAHTCDTRNCLRNDEPGTYEVGDRVFQRYGHLFACPEWYNHLDSVQKGRVATGDRHGMRLHPNSVIRGERSNFAKLTAEKVIAIRKDYADGFDPRAIAHRHNTSRSNVYMIGHRHTWKHIE